MSFFNELKRRNVLRVAAAYMVAAWLVIQVAETLFPVYGLSDAAIRMVVAVLAIGLIPVLIFAWAFEMTPEGLMKESEVDRTQSITPHTGKKLDHMIMVVLALALGYFAFDRFVLDPARDQSKIETALQQGRTEALLESYGENSIAVLPFVNMSSDPEQEFFSDGMTEELLNLLAKIPELRVTARTSSFFFKDKNMPVSEIADALNVTHILEGSVRRDGHRVRITAQLIEARSDTHVWSDTYDRTQESIFAIQDEVASAIAAALVDSFTGLRLKPSDRANNIAAFEAYRTGRLRWWRRSPLELHKAIELFSQAIEYDPSFAPAYAAMADSWLLLALYGDLTRTEASERAMPMIEKALEIDPDSAEAFAAIGLSRWQNGERDAAESALRQAIKLDDDYIPAYLWLAGLLGELGRLPEQSQILQQAMVIDPLNELLAINVARNLASQGDYEAGKELLQGLVSLRPDSATLLRIMSFHATKTGALVEGWQYANRSFDLEPESPVVIETLARAWESIGATEKAERLLLEGLEIADDNSGLQNSYFFLLLRQGRLEKAERLLREQYGESIEALPEQLQQYYYFQKGMISLVANDKDAARNYFENTIRDESDQIWRNGNQVMYATILSALHRAAGNTVLAEQRLVSAERWLRRARLNGVDDADINYQESCIHALRGELKAALDSLQIAYDRGFREAWVLEIDLRPESLHDEPQFIAIREQIKSDIEEARAEVESITLAMP